MSKTGARRCAAYPAACPGSLDNAHQYAEKEKVGRWGLLQIAIHRPGTLSTCVLFLLSKAGGRCSQPFACEEWLALCGLP